MIFLFRFTSLSRLFQLICDEPISSLGGNEKPPIKTTSQTRTQNLACFTSAQTHIRHSIEILHQENISVKSHFFREKLGFAGVNLFFLFLLQNIDCGYPLEPLQRGCSHLYPQSLFWSKNEKNIKTLLKIFNFYNLNSSHTLAYK